MKTFLKKYKKMLLVITFFLGAIVIILSYLTYFTSDFCKNEDYKTFISPNGKHTAQLFNRDCGGFGSAGHISLDGEYIFMSNGNYGHTASVGWKDNKELDIFYNPLYNPLDKATDLLKEYNGIMIKYVNNPCIGLTEEQCKE